MREEPFEVDVPGTQRSGYLRPRYPSTFWRFFDQYFAAGFTCVVAAFLFAVSSSVMLAALVLAVAAVAAVLGWRLFRLAPIGNLASPSSIQSVSAAFRQLGWIVDQERDDWVSAFTSDELFSPRDRVTVVLVGGRLLFNSHAWHRGVLGLAFEHNRRRLESALSSVSPGA